MLNLIVGFVLGAAAIIVAEAFCAYYWLNRLVSESKSKSKSKSPVGEVDHQQSLPFASNKQGTVWALDPDKVPRVWTDDKALKDQKIRKDLLDVLPVKKFAQIHDRSLVLTDSDGSQSTIPLFGCTVLAVSATNLSTRKWAKKFPIKIESANIEIYKGSRTCYLYFETSWEKESWCKVLRLASCVNKERANWYAKLNEDFHDYLTSLKAGYPSFMKPTTGFLCEPTDRAIRADVSSSKVRLFLKKITKKSSRSGLENKASGTPMSLVEEKKMDEKSRSSQDLYPIGSKKTISTEKASTNHLGENTVLPSQSSLTQSGSQGPVSVIPDVDPDDKFSIDEGTLCWNLLISRLFFDAKKNTDMRSSIQARIQRTLSNMRTPGYIGGVTCTSLDVGILPPYIHSMRVLPIDVNEVWAMDIDIEYSGGAILDIETRLEVREAEFEKGIVNASIDSNSVDVVTSDLLKGFENFGKQLNLPGEIVDGTEKKEEGDDGMKKSNSWRSSYVSRWKCIANSIANHVSQVPISLGIKVASVRGTLRLHIKPPPSDQLWFGFTSMPEIDFNLESSVGDHKISSTHVALLLENRFKAAIRDTLVLPNCESVYIPWMLAEKDDWAPKRIAPFVRINQEATIDSSGGEVSGSQPSEANKITKQGANNQLGGKKENAKVTSVHLPTREPAEAQRSLSQNGLTPSPSNNLSTHKQSLQDLKTPLLSYEPETSSSTRSESPETHAASRSVSTPRENQLPTSEDGNGKRTGRKARIIDLGKKMSEKLEEKRRHLEEKSRNIVEKMRGP